VKGRSPPHGRVGEETTTAVLPRPWLAGADHDASPLRSRPWLAGADHDASPLRSRPRLAGADDDTQSIGSGASRSDAEQDSTALLWEGRCISRGELAARAGVLAGRLAAAGVAPGEIVAALLPNGPDFAVLLHALDRCDATLLPLNPRLTPGELAFQLGDAAARRVLHDGGSLAPRAEAAAAESGCAGATPLDALPPPGLAPVCGSLDATLAVIYTSGTTGRPKGALLTHRALLASARASAQHLGCRPDDRWLACLPLFHVGGLSVLLRGALQPAPVVLHPRFDARAVGHALDSDAVTHVSLVPTMLARLLEAWGERPAPSGLRCVLLGGGPAPTSLLERAERLGFPLAPTYGLTEAASQVATRRPRPAAAGAGAERDGNPARVGTDALEPLPGTELRILADDGEDAAADEPGEILVRSPSLMSGYVGQPEASRRALRDGWLHTGDVGCLDASGRLRVLDRRSDLVVSGGENVYPAEVEAALAGHPDVLEAGVAGVPDPAFGSRPAAWLVLRSGRAPSDAELERFCRERLAGYKVPVRFERVAQLPRNAAGKLLRHRLAGPA
jgi:O-succinylbenzoic acid--CoA ligase